ncbi:MAG: 23S rRNA (pseudouridine(1915)-N(3))-methyltransferase RlmH [Saprospiraceae bacterium]|jgi:23S rRNA (pseudouridine1915-N3)-methyltransferase|nr:23S rRNA (pseudouridine(1915)-N(3))-methyltransferase RlmH [Saprospiraceae bacterium]
MKIELLVIGKNNDKYVEQGVKLFEERLTHYCNFELKILPGVRKAQKYAPANLIQQEAEIIMRYVKKEDYIILLDETGKDYTSIEFSSYINKKNLSSMKKIVFIIGGAYGFSPLIYQMAKERISLSKMTFSHQMVRIFFLEQLYRAFTILNDEPYHNF